MRIATIRVAVDESNHAHIVKWTYLWNIIQQLKLLTGLDITLTVEDK